MTVHRAAAGADLGAGQRADIGVKVATLPVVALGVGIGVDYGVHSRLESFLRAGLLLQKPLLPDAKSHR